MTQRPKIVAVDGPAGSGKSSICNKVAERVGWTYINTGAIYRAVGILAAQQGLDLGDEPALAQLVDQVARDLRWDAAERQIWYQQQNLTDRLQSEEVGHAASRLAKQPLVRERLLPVQRALTLAAPKGVLVDGRDIGTVVFPDADLKVFLTASLEERSRRRLQQLGGAGVSAALLAEIQNDIARRDERDAQRDVAPLKQAADAVMVDTSSLSVAETVEMMVDLLRQRQLIES